MASRRVERAREQHGLDRNAEIAGGATVALTQPRMLDTLEGFVLDRHHPAAVCAEALQIA
jgi:hypothetical protein